MRITYLLADPGIGVFGTKGASVHVQEMVRAFRARGHEVTVYCVRRGDKSGTESVQADLAGLEVIDVPVHAASGTAEREVELQRAVTRMVELAAKAPADMVYERYSLFSDAGARLAGRLSVPLVMEVNAPLVDEQQAHRSLHHADDARRITAQALAAADVASCVSSPVAGWVRGVLADANVTATGTATGSGTGTGTGPTVVVTPNGVNTDRIRPAAGRTGRPFTVGFVGTLKPWHGTEVLLQGLARAAHPGKDSWRIEFCGAGPQLESLRRLADELGLAGQTVFHGAVAPERVPAVLTGWDVATAPYPSPARSEDHYFSPLKVYEYLAAGLAVVASGVGELPGVLGAPSPATPDGVLIGERGVIVTPGDPDALANALDVLAADPALTARLGAAGRADVVTRHTWTHRSDDLLALVCGRTVRPDLAGVRPA